MTMRHLVLAGFILWLATHAPGSPAQTGPQHAAHDSPQAQSGPEVGTVDFPVSCNAAAQREFDLGVAQLHHMMYEQARAHFRAAADADPDCAMARWGIAMTQFHPLWAPTPDDRLSRGQQALDAARDSGSPSEREAGFITAAAAYFADPEPPRDSAARDHEARLEAWTEAQRELREAYPEDVEAAAFYALAEVAHAQAGFSPEEEPDYSRQRMAGELLEGFLDAHPDHPGLHHYIIHAYDSAQLAPMAEAVADRYDRIAPHTPHALHMPSHIHVRLGRWQETAQWNERSADAALAQAEVDAQAMMHYAHALDYMMYGYLQLDDEAQARTTLERVRTVDRVPEVAASAYGLAAPQARFHLERQQWGDAAALEPDVPAVLDWERFPEAQALFAYARGLGAARTGDLDLAQAEAGRIDAYVRTLREDGDDYWAYMSEALGEAVGAWVTYEQGDSDGALARMRSAADLEDSMEKHPISPGEVLPVRELYAELLLREGRAEEAAEAFEASLARTPNRRNALAGLERANGSAATDGGGTR